MYSKTGREVEFYGFKRNAQDTEKRLPEICSKVHQNFMFCDIAKANQEYILDNSLDQAILLTQKAKAISDEYFDENYDTGALVYDALEKSDLNKIYIDVDEAKNYISELNKLTYHFFWIASSMRNDELYGGDWTELKLKTEAKIREILPPYCEQFNIDIEKVVEHYKSHVKKSPICEE